MVRKQQGLVFLLLLLGLFILGLTYVVLDKPVGFVYDSTYNQSVVQEDDYQTFFIRSKTVWSWLIVAVSIIIIIAILIKVLQGKPDYAP